MGGSAVRGGKAINDEDILSLWAKHFGSIVNSECPRKRELERLDFEKSIRERMRGSDLPWWCVDIKVKEVLKAISGLKLNKAAGCDGVQPEHVKYGGCDLAL